MSVGGDNFLKTAYCFSFLYWTEFKQLQSYTEPLLCWSVYLKRANLILFDLFSSLSGIKRISSFYFTVLYLEFQSGRIFKGSVYEASWKISPPQKYLGSLNLSNLRNLRIW